MRINKLLATAAVIASFSFVGVQSASAAPELSLFVSAPLMGLADCTGIGGTYSGVGLGGNCTLVNNTLTGSAVGAVSYGGWGLTVGIGTGAPETNQPDLWLAVNGAKPTAGSVNDPLSIGDIVTGYSSPGSPFSAVTDPSGTVEPGLTSVGNLYFDPNNTSNPYLNGSLVFTTGAWVGLTNSPGGADLIGPLVYGGTDYSQEWIQTISCTGNNCGAAIDGASHVGTDLQLLSVDVPTPTPLAILGLGLLVMGGLAAKRRFDARS